MRPDLVLDCRGMRCPLPVIELARHIAEVDIGSTVAVVADDPAAAADVPAWCRLRDHEYAGAGIPVDGAPSYLVRRSH
ncbi:MAG TPA: sulfurtransferase TusA family protein [Jiangellaceae bacterium]|nr:sulfurtransferase TusA family protein [Jiangellaceae bacterium]